MEALHKYDCLRANKSMAAWGVEARVPFLDRDFVDFAMDPARCPVAIKLHSAQRMEKWCLRSAFDYDDLLPRDVLWRQKEQFSDGVGYSWIDTLKEKAGLMVSDSDFAAAAKRFPVNPPRTKEEYWYRTVFEQHFPGPHAAKTVPSEESSACSTAQALLWDSSMISDPSGRSVRAVHLHAHA